MFGVTSKKLSKKLNVLYGKDWDMVSGFFYFKNINKQWVCDYIDYPLMFDKDRIRAYTSSELLILLPDTIKYDYTDGDLVLYKDTKLSYSCSYCVPGDWYGSLIHTTSDNPAECMGEMLLAINNNKLITF